MSNNLRRKKIQLKNKFLFFKSKIASYLSLGLHKGRSSYRRSLRPSKENIKHFFVGNFCPHGSGSGSTTLSGSLIKKARK
jgi:hypothetical protein